MRRLGLTLAALAAATSLTSCGDPCAHLQVSERDRQAVNDGYEVEREGKRGNDCELQRDGGWEVED